MGKTKVFIDFDGTMTRLSGDQFLKEYDSEGLDSKYETKKSKSERLIEKLVDGKMDDLILSGVVETIAKLQAIGVEIYIVSGNHEEYISKFLLRNKLPQQQLSQIKIYGCESNAGISGQGGDGDKVQRIKGLVGKNPEDRNFVFDDSDVVITKCRDFQEATKINLEVITAEPGKFNWQDGSYYKCITTAEVNIKAKKNESKQRDSVEEVRDLASSGFTPVMVLRSLGKSGLSQDTGSTGEGFGLRDSFTLPPRLSQTRDSGPNIESGQLADNNNVASSVLYPSTTDEGLSMFPQVTPPGAISLTNVVAPKISGPGGSGSN